MTKDSFDRSKFEKIIGMSAVGLKQYLIEELKQMNKNCITKGILTDDSSSTPGYIFYKGSFPVMLLAHLDRSIGGMYRRIDIENVKISIKEKVKELKCCSYNKKKNSFEYPNGVEVWSHEGGISGDDRCGVFIILEILKKYDVSVLFTDQEERGVHGRDLFIKDNENIEFLKNNINYMCQIDRGHNARLKEGKSNINPYGRDVVFYEGKGKKEQGEDSKFKKFVLETTKYYEEEGSSTDIVDISKSSKVSSFNIACGYFDEHQESEIIVIDEMINCYDAVMRVLDNTDVSKKYRMK